MNISNSNNEGEGNSMVINDIKQSQPFSPIFDDYISETNNNNIEKNINNNIQQEELNDNNMISIDNECNDCYEYDYSKNSNNMNSEIHIESYIEVKSQTSFNNSHSENDNFNKKNPKSIIVTSENNNCNNNKENSVYKLDEKEIFKGSNLLNFCSQGVGYTNTCSSNFTNKTSSSKNAFNENLIRNSTQNSNVSSVGFVDSKFSLVSNSNKNSISKNFIKTSNAGYVNDFKHLLTNNPKSGNNSNNNKMTVSSS
jgi:hypothetical protein